MSDTIAVRREGNTNEAQAPDAARSARCRQRGAASIGLLIGSSWRNAMRREFDVVCLGGGVAGEADRARRLAASRVEWSVDFAKVSKRLRWMARDLDDSEKD
jgi:hypothetical protein